MSSGWPPVYPPSEDTNLLIGVLPELRNAFFWDLGCGSGEVGLHAAEKGAHVLFTDINPYAVAHALKRAWKANLHAEGMVADLLVPYTLYPDVTHLAFNPPYLPRDPEVVLEPYLNLALEGGKTGFEVTGRFLDHLETAWLRGFRPRVYLLCSSLSGIDRALLRLEHIAGSSRILATFHMGFETVAVVGAP